MFSIILFSTCLFGISITLYWSWYFSNWSKNSIFITITYTFSCILSSFLIINLPLDIISAYYDFCLEKRKFSNCTQPYLYVEKDTLWFFWNFVYWTTFVLTWTFLPFLKSFVSRGDFTLGGKVKSAIIDNLVYYGSFILISIIVLIYLISKHTVEMKLTSFKTLIITTSNTWGLFLVICFMGYGLVNLPRSLWHKSNPIYSLRKYFFKLSQLNVEIHDRKEELNFTISKIIYLQKNLPTDNTKLYKYSSLILENLKNHDTLIDKTVDIEETQFTITENKLVKLNKDLSKRFYRYFRTLCLYCNTLLNAAYYQDIVNSINSQKGILIEEDLPALPKIVPIKIDRKRKLSPRFCYLWHCYFRQYAYKFTAIISMLFSFLTVWSECLFFVKIPQLSIPALLINSMMDKNHIILVVFTAFCSIGYIGICVLYSVYHLKIFGYYRLIKNHLSDETSLLFCATLLSRLIPALCLNFLGLVHLDYHIVKSGEKSHPETSFTRFMGHLDVVPFISQGFNIYFPIVVVVLCIVSYLNLGTRLLRLIGVPQMLVTSDNFEEADKNLTDIDQIIADAIEDGKLILNRARLENKYSRQS